MVLNVFYLENWYFFRSFPMYFKQKKQNYVNYYYSLKIKINIHLNKTQNRNEIFQCLQSNRSQCKILVLKKKKWIKWMKAKKMKMMKKTKSLPHIHIWWKIRFIVDAIFFPLCVFTKSEYGVYYVHTVCINNPLSYTQIKSYDLNPLFVLFRWLCVLRQNGSKSWIWREKNREMAFFFWRRVHEFISCVNCRTRNVVSKYFHTRFSVCVVRVLDGLRLKFPVQDSVQNKYKSRYFVIDFTMQRAKCSKQNNTRMNEKKNCHLLRRFGLSM